MKSLRILSALFATTAFTACALEDKPVSEKGEIDQSTPPGSPVADLGKADEPDGLSIQVDVQSPHPYRNGMEEVYRIDLGGLPSCASQARVHFSALRTEAGYDYVTVQGPVAEEGVESFDGTRDGVWSRFFSIGRDGSRALYVGLNTDESITRHGFAIDKVSWQGSPVCPRIAWIPCSASQIDITPPRGVCECQIRPTCTEAADVTVSYVLSFGRGGNGHRAIGTDGYSLGTAPTDGIQATFTGTVDRAALSAIISDAGHQGLLGGEGYDLGGTFPRQVFTFELDGRIITFAAAQGGHQAAVESLIGRFEALFRCDLGGAAAMACGDGFVCSDGGCMPEDSCACTEEYAPVCGMDGITYGNDCFAWCSEMATKHAGECGIAGDPCGGKIGLPCQDAFKCRYDTSAYAPPYPDALGACVNRTYCDAVADCDPLPHPAVPGAWACDANACAWRTGPATWQTLPGGGFATAHPYGNNASTWKQVNLPAGMSRMRLRSTGTFALENGYDVLTVWTWQNNAWRKVKTYTGSAAPALTDVFVGRYHYLHFASDSSVTAYGFNLAAEVAL